MSPGLFLFSGCLRPPSSFRPFCQPFALRMPGAASPGFLEVAALVSLPRFPTRRSALTDDWHSLLAFPCTIILSPL